MEKTPLSQGAQRLYELSSNSDFVVVVKDVHFDLHKFVLLSTSLFFRRLFNSREFVTARLEANELTATAVRSVINFMYYDYFIPADNFELLQCAALWEMPEAVELCCALIVLEELCVENCFEVLSLFVGYGLQRAIHQTEEFIIAHFDEVLEAFCVRTAGLGACESLIRLWQKSEFELYEVVARSTWHRELSSKLRFGLMSAHELETVKKQPLGSEPSIARAIEYNRLKNMNERLTFYAEEDVQNQPRGAAETLVFFQGDIYEVNVFEGYILVTVDPVGKKFLFETRTQRWLELPLKPHPEIRHAAIAYCSRRIYVLGGMEARFTSSSVEHLLTSGIDCYDFATNSWIHSHVTLPTAMGFHAACCLERSIYVAGGVQMLAGSWKFSLNLFKLNMSTGEFEARAPLPVKPCAQDKKGKTCELFAFQGAMLYLAEGLVMMSYNPESDLWQNLILPSLNLPYFGVKNRPSITVSGNLIYVYDPDRDFLCRYHLDGRYRELKVPADFKNSAFLAGTCTKPKGCCTSEHEQISLYLYDT